MRKIPMRQIHLDFHTTATIPGIGKDFDPDEFAKTLKDAKVEWINIFGKCHHGMFYYNTKIGTRHPYMEGELTAGQVEALRKYGIKFGMYTCVGWNEEWCDRHPEWMEVNPAGVLGNKTPFRAMWRKLCLNHQAYTDMIKAEIQEEFDLFRPDGYWIDIIFQNECVCGVCKTEMLRQGLDPENTLHRRRHDREVVLRFQRDVYAFTHALDPELNIYFNGHPYEMDTADEPDIAGRNKQELSDCIDIESLPSQQWGYSHFPVAINYINKYPREITMMNGRFHTVWGDFGSLRNTRALEYESFRALANGAGVCVGDQLHPSGKLDPTIYRRIGGVFAQVEAREPWCADSVKVAQGAVYAVKPVIATDEEEAKAAEGGAGFEMLAGNGVETVFGKFCTRRRGGGVG